MRLSVFGGAFDPIHRGHLAVAAEVLRANEADRVLFVPAGDPWQKQVHASAEDRFIMTVLGAAGDERHCVSRLEIDRRGPSYTVETLEALAAFYGSEVRLSLLCGADAAVNIPTWHRAHDLAQIADVIVIGRSGTDPAELPSGPPWPAFRRVAMEPIDVSSRDIRSRIVSGRPVDFLVPPQVAAYIGAEGIYSGAPEEHRAT